MKYIRTIEEPNKIHVVAWTCCGFIGFLDTKNGCDISHIWKQADNIEELCDEFVVETKYEGKQLFKHVTVVRNILEKAEKSSYMNIYGAIWTNKGLIYVAKMNDKGELELL